MTRRTAAWSLGIRHEKSYGKSRASVMGKLIKIRWSPFSCNQVGQSHGRVETRSETWFQNMKSSFFWITDVEVTQNNAHTVGNEGQCG